MYSYSLRWASGPLGPRTCGKAASSESDKFIRRVSTRSRERGGGPLLASASGGAFTTTLHKDGTVTYHFASNLLLQTAVAQPIGDAHDSAIVSKSDERSTSSVQESSSAQGHSLYEQMHARVSTAVADLDAAILSLDQDGFGSEHNIDNLSAAATRAAPSADEASKNGEQRDNYVPEEDLGPLIGAEGIQIPRAALLRSEEIQSLPALQQQAESRGLEGDPQLQRESAAEDSRHHVRLDRESLQELQLDGNMQRAHALHVLQLFSDTCRSGDLGGALQILESAVKARRHDIVGRVRHKHFLREASDQAQGVRRQQAMRLAMRFVQVLPRQYTDARTYNMLISVCVRAKDLTQALHAADMLESTGRKLDTILYTNLIGVCAAVGTADKAFQLYTSMKAEGLKSDPQVYTALVSACSREILEAPASNRRLQLVLLERAQGVLAEMRAQRIKTDAHLWNALIAAAGRAGQLQRAYQSLEDMQNAGCQPDAYTYGALIDASARACRSDQALEVYRRALRDGFKGSVMIYTSVVAACGAACPVDLLTALNVYADMQRNAVQPDVTFYAALIEVAGAAGDLETAFKIFEDAKRYKLPQQVLQSALIQACIACSSLGKARELYHAMRAGGQAPTLKAFNSLVNAYGRAMRLGDTVALVKDLVDTRMKPDMRTFAAILSACQRAKEPELAFEVYRIMKQQGQAVDEVVCFILLRLCFNCLRDAWLPGGYPPKKDGFKARTALAHIAAGPALLRALGDTVTTATLERLAGGSGEASWMQRAVDVYREAVSGGCKPPAHIIERVLACLRQPTAPRPEAPAALPSPFKAGGLVGAEEDNRAEALLQSNSRDPAKIFDFRAVSILEEAVSLGALPQFSLSSKGPLDLQSIPPCTAEVYMLAVVAQLQRGGEPKIGQDLTILVPPYDPAHIFRPSHEPEASEADLELETSGRSGPEALLEEEEEPAGAHGAAGQTGLGVAGMLRRIGLWAKEDAAHGRITITGRELLRWKRAADRAAQHAQNASSVLQESHWIGTSISTQQKNIRMGLGQLGTSSRAPKPRRRSNAEAAHRTKVPSQAMPPVWSQP